MSRQNIKVLGETSALFVVYTSVSGLGTAGTLDPGDGFVLSATKAVVDD